MELHYRASQEEAGRSLLSVLRGPLRLSAAMVRRLKGADAFRVNGASVHTDYRLQPGDELRLTLTEPEPDYPSEEGEIRVLYEDECILAVDKPRGMIVHPTHARLTGTLANRVWGYIRNTGSGGCHLVNRLDRDTGGVTLFAKNSHICALMGDAVTEKLYHAVVCGIPDEESGSITFPIRRLNETDMKRVCAADGSEARTDYRVLAHGNGLSLLELRLYTGRTHQIRVHCAEMGWPLLGDRLYGTEESVARSEALGETMQNLWCVRMTFRHPLTGESVTVEAPPEGLKRTLFDSDYGGK